MSADSVVKLLEYCYWSEIDAIARRQSSRCPPGTASVEVASCCDSPLVVKMSVEVVEVKLMK